MNGFGVERLVQPTAAFVVAVGVHALVAAGLMYMPQATTKPPQVVGGFEVVDLAAFGAAGVLVPLPDEKKPEEKTDPLREPEPVSQPEPEPEQISDLMPEPEPEPSAQPEPEPIVSSKPKPPPVRDIQPKQKTPPRPVQKAEAAPPPQQPSTATVGRENAFVPPSSTAAYLRNPKPTYPAIAQRRGMQGQVLLFVRVSAKGETLAVTVKKSSGYVLLDKAAVKAVSAWQFSPALRGGVPIAAEVEVPIRFILNDV